MKLVSRYAHWGIAAVCAIASCSDPISEVKFEDWQPTVALPVANTSFTLRDALREADFSDYVSEDPSSALRLTIDQELFSTQPGELLKLPAVTIPVLEQSTRYNLAEEGIDFGLSRVDLDGGYIRYDFLNDQPEEVVVQLTCTNFVKDGVALDVQLVVPPFQEARDSVRAAGYQLLLPNGGDVAIDYTATTRGTNRDVELPLGALSLRAAEFEYVEGRLETLAVELAADSVELDFFEAFEPGSVRLVNPTASIVVDNEVGAPVHLVARLAEGELRDGSSVAITTPLSSGFAFDFPSVDEGLTPKRSEFTIDRETSNVVNVLNDFPTKLRLDLDAVVNADSLQEEFHLHRDASLSARIKLDMPLAVQFDDFRLERDFAFDGSGFAEASSASMRLLVNNGFGLEARTQVYFFDGNEQLLDSLFAQPTVVLAAAEVDDEGATTAPVEQLTEVALTEQQLGRLADGRLARVVVSLTSPSTGNQTTRLYFDNAIGVKLGAQLTVSAL